MLTLASMGHSFALATAVAKHTPQHVVVVELAAELVARTHASIQVGHAGSGLGNELGQVATSRDSGNNTHQHSVC